MNKKKEKTEKEKKAQLLWEAAMNYALEKINKLDNPEVEFLIDDANYLRTELETAFAAGADWLKSNDAEHSGVTELHKE